jgi:hypothetical protein
MTFLFINLGITKCLFTLRDPQTKTSVTNVVENNKVG